MNVDNGSARSLVGPRLGTLQVISIANSDANISKELTLLRQVGSTASFGNLLAIPIEHSLLYASPLAVNSTAPQM